MADTENAPAAKPPVTQRAEQEPGLVKCKDCHRTKNYLTAAAPYCEFCQAWRDLLLQRQAELIDETTAMLKADNDRAERKAA